MILNGDYEVGEKINEVALSKMYGVSRGPVREALRQMEQEGLVEYVPNKGCTVKMLNKASVYESSMLRCGLECMAVEMCMCNYSEQTVRELERTVQKLGEAADKKSLVDIVSYDEIFHSLIAKEAGSQKLYTMWKSFEGEMAAIFYTSSKKNLMPAKYITRNHMWIVDRIKAKDLEGAKKVLKEHYMSDFERLDVSK